VLAGKGQRLITGLLLREAGDRVIAGVIDRNPPVHVERQSSAFGKAGVAQIVLCPCRARYAEIRRSPVAGATIMAAHEKNLLSGSGMLPELPCDFHQMERLLAKVSAYGGGYHAKPGGLSLIPPTMPS
jgi:hypothetical protein